METYTVYFDDNNKVILYLRNISQVGVAMNIYKAFKPMISTMIHCTLVNEEIIMIQQYNPFTTRWELIPEEEWETFLEKPYEYLQN